MARIPSTSRAALEQAMERFDRGERSEHWREDVSGWRADSHHKYAITHRGRLYPVKEIIRLAKTTRDEDFLDFSGGRHANSYVPSYDLEIVPLKPGEPVP